MEWLWGSVTILSGIAIPIVLVGSIVGVIVGSVAGENS